MKILTFGGVYVTIKSPNMRLPADLRADAGIGTGDSHKSNKLDYSYSDNSLSGIIPLQRPHKNRR